MKKRRALNKNNSVENEEKKTGFRYASLKQHSYCKILFPEKLLVESSGRGVTQVGFRIHENEHPVIFVRLVLFSVFRRSRF